MAKQNRENQKRSKDELDNPMERYHFDDEHDAIQHFFSWFKVEEAQDLLYELFRYWIVYQDKLSHDEFFEKDRRVFFYEQLRIVLKAVYLLEVKWIKEGNKLHCVITEPKKSVS